MAMIQTASQLTISALLQCLITVADHGCQLSGLQKTFIISGAVAVLYNIWKGLDSVLSNNQNKSKPY